MEVGRIEVRPELGGRGVPTQLGEIVEIGAVGGEIPDRELIESLDFIRKLVVIPEYLGSSTAGLIGCLGIWIGADAVEYRAWLFIDREAQERAGAAVDPAHFATDR